MNRFVPIFFTLFLWGCQEIPKTKTIYKDLDARLEIDSICIPLDSISLASYPSATFVYTADSTTKVYAFNTKTWAIDVFDLNKQCLPQHITLEREGANQVPYIKTLQVVSPDSIICFEDNGLLMLDSKGNVFRRETMIYSTPDCTGCFELGQFLQPYYNRQQQKVYGRLVTSKEPYPYPEGEKLFAEYDMKSKSWSLLPMELPTYMQANWTRMGQNRHLNMWIGEDRIAYNFTCLSDLFVYDLTKRELKVGGGESRLVENNVAPYRGNMQDDNAKWQHWIDSPVFYAPIYDNHRHLYYRIQQSEFCGYVEGNPTPYDKKIILAVFNERLEMLAEFRLDNYKYNFLYFGTDKQGLIIDGNNPKDKYIDYEVFKVYRLKVVI